MMMIFSVGAIEPQFYQILLEKLEASDDELPQFDNFDELKLKLGEIFASKTRDEWSEIFGMFLHHCTLNGWIIFFTQTALMLVLCLCWRRKRLGHIITTRLGAHSCHQVTSSDETILLLSPPAHRNAPARPPAEQDTSHTL